MEASCGRVRNRLKITLHGPSRCPCSHGDGIGFGRCLCFAGCVSVRLNGVIQVVSLTYGGETDVSGV